MRSEFQNHQPNHRGGRDFAQLSKFTKFTKVAQEDPTSIEEERRMGEERRRESLLLLLPLSLIESTIFKITNIIMIWRNHILVTHASGDYLCKIFDMIRWEVSFKITDLITEEDATSRS